MRFARNEYFYLEHKLGNDPMEDGAPVGEALLVLAASDAVEVPGGPGHHLVKQLHHNPARGLAVNSHIEKHPANRSISVSLTHQAIW